MKNTLIFAVYFSLVLLSACDEEPEKKPNVPLVHFQVADDAITPGMQRWVYISDPNGEFLDKAYVSNSQSFTLNGFSDPGFVDVTIYSVNRFQTGFMPPSLITFRNIPTGKELRIVNQPPQFDFFNGIRIGEFRVNMTNLPTNDFQLIGNTIFGTTDGPSFAGSGRLRYQGSTLAGTMDLFRNGADVTVTTYRGGKRVYGIAKDVNINEQVSFNYQTLKEFEHTVLIPEQATGQTFGVRNGLPSFLLCQSHPSRGYLNNNSLGYIDGFDTYQTTVNSMMSGRQVTYSKRGERSTSISFPDISMNVWGRSIDNFSYSGSLEFQYMKTEWSLMGTALIWQVYSAPANSYGIKFIPKEVKQNFPSTSLTNMRFMRFSIFTRLDNFTYDDLVNETFGIADKRTTHEYYESMQFF